MIFQESRHDRKTLFCLSRVCKHWFAIVTSILWQDADPDQLARFVKSHERRQIYAMHIRNVHFWAHETFWGGSVSGRPIFTAIQTLELSVTALRDNGGENVVPFLLPSLKRLVLYDDGNRPASNVDLKLDDHWLVHITTSCLALRQLNITPAVSVSPHVLTNLLQSCRHLRELKLSELVSPAIELPTLEAIFWPPEARGA
jgi:hypothetical protein